MNQKLNEIVERLKGFDDGLIEIKDLSQTRIGTWQLKYKEKGKSSVQVITSKDRDELDQLRHELGGRNLETCSADDKFLWIDNTWSGDDLLRVGHRITKIYIRGRRTIRDTIIPIDFPEDTGQRHTLESIKTKKDIASLRLSDQESCEFTRLFSDYKEFNNLVNFIFGHEYLKCLKWSVHELCTENIKIKKQCRWKKTKAGDGTARMILELCELDGVRYEKCLRQDLFEAADDMFSVPCKRLTLKKKIVEKNVCQWAAERGDVDISGYEASV